MALRQRSYLERFFTSQYGQTIVGAYVALLVGTAGLVWTEHPDAAMVTFFLGAPFIGWLFWAYAVWRWMKGFSTQERAKMVRRGLLIAFVLLQTLDVLTTVYVLEHGGWEGNLLMAWAMHHLGPFWVFVKIAAISVAYYYMSRWKPKALGYVVAFCALVIVNNTLTILGFNNW